MGYALNAITAPDAYAAASTIAFPADVVLLDVVNNAIYWQVADVIGTSFVWESLETYMLPGSRRISGKLGGIRIRAATPLAQSPAGGLQAVVTIRTTP